MCCVCQKLQLRDACFADISNKIDFSIKDKIGSWLLEGREKADQLKTGLQPWDGHWQKLQM